jgi:hypothetical protein
MDEIFVLDCWNLQILLVFSEPNVREDLVMQLSKEVFIEFIKYFLQEG